MLTEATKEQPDDDLTHEVRDFHLDDFDIPKLRTEFAVYSQINFVKREKLNHLDIKGLAEFFTKQCCKPMGISL